MIDCHNKLIVNPEHIVSNDKKEVGLESIPLRVELQSFEFHNRKSLLRQYVKYGLWMYVFGSMDA